MNISLAKLVPRASALAVVGYCLWPTISDFMATPPAPEAPKLPEVAVTALNPVVGDLAARNPFADPYAPPPVAKAIVKTTPKKEASKTDTFAKKAAKLKNIGEYEQSKIPENIASLLATLNLEATIVSPQGGAAIINGRQYSVRDVVVSSDSGFPPCKVVSVFPHKVLLESEGRTFELRYSNGDAKSAGGSDTTGKRRSSTGE